MLNTGEFKTLKTKKQVFTITLYVSIWLCLAAIYEKNFLILLISIILTIIVGYTLHQTKGAMKDRAKAENLTFIEEAARSISSNTFPNLTKKIQTDPDMWISKFYRYFIDTGASINQIFEIYEDQLKDSKVLKVDDRLSEVEGVVKNLDKKEFPKLIAWRQANKNGLVETLLRMAEREQRIPVGTLAANLESDLQHQ